MSDTTTWRKAILAEMRIQKETWKDVVSFVLGDNMMDAYSDSAYRSAKSLDAEFYHGYGSASGCGFTLWTKARVYFPTEYDGAESVSSVPRNPCEEATEHV